MSGLLQPVGVPSYSLRIAGLLALIMAWLLLCSVHPVDAAQQRHEYYQQYHTRSYSHGHNKRRRVQHHPRAMAYTAHAVAPSAKATAHASPAKPAPGKTTTTVALHTPPEKGRTHPPEPTHPQPTVLKAAATSQVPHTTEGAGAPKPSNALANTPSRLTSPVDERHQPLHSALRQAKATGLAGSATASHSSPSMAQVAMALLGVLGLAWISLKTLLPRLFGQQGSAGTTPHHALLDSGDLLGSSSILRVAETPRSETGIQVVSSLAVGPQQWLKLVTVGAETILIAQTPQGISLLKTMESATLATNQPVLPLASASGPVKSPAPLSVAPRPTVYDEVKLKHYQDQYTQSA